MSLVVVRGRSVKDKVPPYTGRAVAEVAAPSLLKTGCFVEGKNAPLVCQSCTPMRNLKTCMQPLFFRRSGLTSQRSVCERREGGRSGEVKGLLCQQFLWRAGSWQGGTQDAPPMPQCL